MISVIDSQAQVPQLGEAAVGIPAIRDDDQPGGIRSLIIAEILAGPILHWDEKESAYLPAYTAKDPLAVNHSAHVVLAAAELALI